MYLSNPYYKFYNYCIEIVHLYSIAEHQGIPIVCIYSL